MHGRIDQRFLFMRTAKFCLFALLFSSTGISHASGFSVPGGVSVTGLGTADALLANPVEIGALAITRRQCLFTKAQILCSD